MKKIIIIGGGLAGLTLSNQLVDKFEVIVLEKGDKHARNLPKQKFLKRDFGVIATYSYGVGGTTKLWHNGLIPLSVYDVKTKKFQRMIRESECHINAAANSLNFCGDYQKAYYSEREYFQKYTRNIFKAAEHDVILVPDNSGIIKPKKQVKIVTGAEVLGANYIGKELKELIVTIEGKITVINADIVVVCAGGISTPNVLRTLQVCDSDRQHSDCLIDHPMGFVGKIKTKTEVNHLFDKMALSKRNGYSCRAGLVIESDGLKGIFYFRPAATLNNDLDLYKFKSMLAAANWKKRISLIFNRKFWTIDIMSEVFLHLFNIKIRPSYYSVWVVFEQRKSDKNHNFILRKDSNSDVIHWSITDDELSTYQKSIRKISDLLKPVVEESSFIEQNIESFLWSAAHHSGTVGLGINSADIDENLKLNAADNVYVCDGSVIQEHGYSNTGLTIAQLAHRLAAHLKDLL